MLKALQTCPQRSSSVSRTALRKSLLTAEIGITVVLLVVTPGCCSKAAFARSGCGMRWRHDAHWQYSLPDKKYDTPEKRNEFNEALLARVRAMPGVRGAALGTTVPGAGYWGDDVFTVKEHPPLKTGEDLLDALTRWADPGYFSALGIPLVSGRFFTSDERVERSYKVIVSRQLVQQYFAGENPIGKHLHFPARAHDGAPDLVDWEIVGVVGDILYQVGKEPKATAYFPILEGRGNATLAVHTAMDPLPFSVPLQKQIALLDPELPVSDAASSAKPVIIGASLVNASPECNPCAGFCYFVADSCFSGIVRRAFVPCHSADLGTGNPHGPRRATGSALAVDADGWPATSAVRAGAGLGDEPGGDTRLPVDAFRNETS